MHLVRCALAVILVLVCPVPALPQQTPRPVQRDPQAVAIAQQSHTMASAATSPIQDVVATGDITWVNGRTGTITLKTKGSQRLRQEITLPTGLITYVINAGKGHGLQNGKRHGLPLWVTAYQRPEFVPAFSRLADYAGPETELIYLGSADVAGRPAHHIRISALPKDDTPAEIEELISEFHVYVDTQTLLVVKTQSFLFSPEIVENRSPVETYYSDYRSVGGLLIPHRIVRYISGHKDCEITLASVRLNVGLADSEFDN